MGVSRLHRMFEGEGRVCVRDQGYLESSRVCGRVWQNHRGSWGLWEVLGALSPTPRTRGYFQLPVPQKNNPSMSPQPDLLAWFATLANAGKSSIRSSLQNGEFGGLGVGMSIWRCGGGGAGGRKSTDPGLGPAAGLFQPLGFADYFTEVQASQIGLKMADQI